MPRKQRLVPKVIDGKKYYSIGQVAALVGKTGQTVRLWDMWSEAEEAEGRERFIPRPIRVGKLGVRYFAEEDLPAIKKFAKNIPYGLLSPYNRQLWGERGEEIKVDKSLERRLREKLEKSK